MQSGKNARGMGEPFSVHNTVQCKCPASIAGQHCLHAVRYWVTPDSTSVPVHTAGGACTYEVCLIITGVT